MERINVLTEKKDLIAVPPSHNRRGAVPRKLQISTLSSKSIGIALCGERTDKWISHRAGQPGGMFDSMLQDVPGRIFDSIIQQTSTL